MQRMRNRIRAIFTWLLLSGLGAILLAVSSEWFIEVAKDKGFYANAGARWDRVMGEVLSFVTSHVVLYPLTGFAGLVGGMWLDTILRRASAENGPEEPAFDLRGLHVDRINVEVGKLYDEHSLEVSFWGFNACGQTMKLVSIEGPVFWNERPAQQGDRRLDGLFLRDPEPREWGNYSEFLIVASLPIKPTEVPAMRDRLESGERMFMGFSQVKFSLELGSGDYVKKAELPLRDDGVGVWKIAEGHYRCRKWITGRVKETLGASALF